MKSKVNPTLLYENFEMFSTLVAHSSRVIKMFEQDEEYESCAFYKLLEDELKDYVLGYKNNKEIAHYYAYLVCKNHGEIMDMIKDHSDLIVIFKFHGIFYQFEIDSLTEWKELIAQTKEKI